MKERKFKPCITKQLLSMFELRCEWGLSHSSSHIFGFLRHISPPRSPRLQVSSLRSRHLEVVGERENGRARGRHACPLACLLFSRAFFLVPTTSDRLLRSLASVIKSNLQHKCFLINFENTNGNANVV